MANDLIFDLDGTCYDSGNISVKTPSYSTGTNIIIRTVDQAGEHPWWVGLTEEQTLDLIEALSKTVSRQQRLDIMARVAKSMRTDDEDQ